METSTERMSMEQEEIFDHEDPDEALGDFDGGEGDTVMPARFGHDYETLARRAMAVVYENVLSFDERADAFAEAQVWATLALVSAVKGGQGV